MFCTTGSFLPLSSTSMWPIFFSQSQPASGSAGSDVTVIYSECHLFRSCVESGHALICSDEKQNKKPPQKSKKWKLKVETVSVPPLVFPSGIIVGAVVRTTGSGSIFLRLATTNNTAQTNALMKGTWPKHLHVWWKFTLVCSVSWSLCDLFSSGHAAFKLWCESLYFSENTFIETIKCALGGCSWANVNV